MRPPRPLLPREFVLAHKRSRLLEAVAELSAEHGYAAMSVTDIVGRAGVARKTLYETFDGKEEIFLAAVDAGFAALLEVVEGACAGEGEWNERLRAALEALLDYLAEHPAEAQMLIVEAPGLMAASVARYDETIARFTELLKELTPAVPGGSEAIEEGVVGGVAFILNRELRRGRGDRLNDLTEELNEFVLAPWASTVR